MNYGKNQHILNAASNLLGICFVIITALRVTALNHQTWADEISLVSAICLLSACIFSYVSMRIEKYAPRCEWWADHTFLFGVFLLFVAVAAFYGGY